MIRMRSLEGLLITAILLGLAVSDERSFVPALAPEWIGRLGYAPASVFPIELEEHGMPVLPARINGRPTRLVFDTGNLVGLLIPSGESGRLHLRVTGQEVLLDSDGKPVGTFREFTTDSVELLGKRWFGERAMESPSSRLGLFGPRFVRDGGFTLDLPGRRLATAASLDQAEGFGTVVPLIPSPRLPGMIVVTGVVQGDTVPVQIDTGKSRTCVDPTFARRHHLPSHGGRIELGSVRLAGLIFDVPSAKEVDFSGISGGLASPILVGIGADFLQRVVLTVDYERGTVRFSRSTTP